MNAEDAKIEVSEVCHAKIQMKPFFTEDPETWFLLLDSQFRMHRLTSDQGKFDYTLSQLDAANLKEITDVMKSPPVTDKYETLKAELIRRLTTSREAKIRQLMTHEELGDRRPTHFLRHLRNLAGPGVADEVLQTIWTSRLPANAQSLVACQPDTKLDQLAVLADRLHDMVTENPSVSQISTDAASMRKEISEMARRMDEMATQMSRMSRARETKGPSSSSRSGSCSHGKSRSGSRSSSCSRGRSRSKSFTRSASSHKNFPVCWYHSKFGEEARRCTKPCDFEAPLGN